ncbi:diguanylate cyclase [Egicoccus sp. AB-alg2]|uniref:GGDEF domain-containing protein n=1 Tax=Egicoccus sp. AB-alg2 TaxID=3242693 RepID=UPI00359D60A5
MGFEELDDFDTAWRRRRQDPQTALHVAQRLRDRASATGDDVLRGRALTLEGACHALRNDYMPALRALLEAVAILDEAASADDRAPALAEYGYLECVLGEVSTGMERLLDALALYEQLGDLAGAAATLNRIGVTFYSRGDLTDARQAYERCLALHEDLQDEVAAAGVRNNLAKIATAEGDVLAARALLHTARRAFAAAGEWRGVAMTEHNLAMADEVAGALADARSGYEAALRNYGRAGHLHGAVESRMRLGRLVGADEPGRATSLLLQAHGDAERLGLPRECAQSAEALADLCEDLGKPTEALRWLRHLREVERSLFDTASEQRVRALQVRYQLERLERDRITDALTGLLNRRGLQQVLDEAVRRRVDGRPTALLLLDLDDFKQVNDRFSHAVGDQVLRRVATLLQASVRPTDACARYGGEEYVVVLADCDHVQAHRIAEDVRVAVRDDGRWAELAHGLEVTTSVGVAELRVGMDGELLLQAADRALYAAKHAGKDRVLAAS